MLMRNQSSDEASAIVVFTREYASRQVLNRLGRAGYQASELPFDDGAVRAIAKMNPSLVLLAIQPAADSERDIVSRVADATDGAVLVLGPGMQQAGFLESLRGGADACISESDGLDRLVAQVEAITRRVRRPDGLAGYAGSLRVGNLTIDFRRYEVCLGETRLHFTPMEFRILAVLAESAGTVLSPAKIVAAVHDVPYTPHQARDTVKVYVRSIRQKLAMVDPDTEYIVNARGFGYMLEPTAIAETSTASAAG